MAMKKNGQAKVVPVRKGARPPEKPAVPAATKPPPGKNSKS